MVNLTNAYTDKELFALIAEGDETAFKMLFSNYTRQLKPFLYRLDDSGMLMEEVIQETMLKVWLNRDQLPLIEYPKSWVFKIAANLLYNQKKRLVIDKKAKEHIERKLSLQHNQLTETIDYNQLKMHVRDAIGQLPARRREIYILRREQGLSIPEIAETLGLSTNTVRNTLSTAGEFIKDFLVGKGYSPATLLFILHWL